MKVFVQCNQAVISGLVGACELLTTSALLCRKIIVLVILFGRDFDESCAHEDIKDLFERLCVGNHHHNVRSNYEQHAAYVSCSKTKTSVT